ncbi:MAG: Urease accessory protein UreD 1, partial [Pseudomonadota bacterium]
MSVATEFNPQAFIQFVKRPDGATGVGRQLVGYPFHLGRPLKFSGDPIGMSSLYLQSCSGGIFEGDDLGLRFLAQAGTQAHLTSAASTIVHSMNDGREA